MTRIRLITLDLDDTLWEVAPVIVRAEQTLQDWLNREHPAWLQHVGRDGLASLRREIAAQHPQHRHDLSRMRLLLLEELLRRSAHPEHDVPRAAQAAFEVFLTARNQVTLFDGVEQVLAELNRDYRVHALSNGNADVHRVGLGRYFHEHFSAARAGQAKPHPRMFEMALEAAGVAPEQAVHVGDHPEQDVLAARAVGMRTVWVNATGSPWTGEATPDAVIRSVRELPAVLRRLQDLTSP